MNIEMVKALIKAKQEFGAIAKDKKNPHFKSEYASLDAVLAAVEPALHKHGLVLMQTIEVIGDGGAVLVTKLLHESGESFDSNYPLPAATDPQKFGAGITYARRYALCALLSVTADEDDDGNTAAAVATSRPGCITAKQVQLLQIELKKQAYTPGMMVLFKADLEVESAKDILSKDFDEAIAKARDPRWTDYYRQLEETKKEPLAA